MQNIHSIGLRFGNGLLLDINMLIKIKSVIVTNLAIGINLTMKTLMTARQSDHEPYYLCNDLGIPFSLI